MYFKNLNFEVSENNEDEYKYFLLVYFRGEHILLD